MRSLALVAMLALSGCGKGEKQENLLQSVIGADAATAVATPGVAAVRGDLSACPHRDAVDAELRSRKGPITLPAAFAPYAAISDDNLAVSAANGATVCVDVSWMDEIAKPKVSDDARFLAFDWVGYEAFGHIVVDRSGAGQVLETGNAPLAPSGGGRFAAIDLSESAFGGLNAFAVWRIDSTGISELAKFEDGMPYGDWKVEGWRGNSCVNLSVLPSLRSEEDAADYAAAKRDPWHAAESSGWKPAPGPCPGA